MKNIHILPTDKPSRLHFTEFFEELVFTPKYEKLDGVNIYITSDEEIKEGDWFIANNRVHKCIRIDENTSCPFITLNLKGEEIGHFKTWRTKIILTTDQDLIKDGVQAIDDDFLEWFVKNPSCESVEVLRCPIEGLYTIIPSEEPKKVLTEKDIFNQKDIDAVTEYINKEQQKQGLIDMMKDDEELGLYDDTKANKIELVCKDCSDSLEDCTCILSTIDFPKQEDEFCYYSGLPSPAAYSKEEIKLEEIFNDDKKENIKKFIDEINNPSQPNQALIDAAERILGRNEVADGDMILSCTFPNTVKSMVEMAEWQQEISYSEEDMISFGEFIFKHSLLTHTRGVKSLFEQFKNK